MPAFKRHFIEKYFAYRQRYVDHILAQAPARARLAVLAEIARLGFMLCGNVLCALILWALTAGAAARHGWATWLPFALLAAVPSAFAALSLSGIGAALRDRRRIFARTAPADEAAAS